MLRQHSLKEQASKLEFDVFVVDQLIHQVLYDVGTTMMRNLSLLFSPDSSCECRRPFHPRQSTVRQSGYRLRFQ